MPSSHRALSSELRAVLSVEFSFICTKQTHARAAKERARDGAKHIGRREEGTTEDETRTCVRDRTRKANVHKTATEKPRVFHSFFFLRICISISQKVAVQLLSAKKPFGVEPVAALSYN